MQQIEEKAISSSNSHSCPQKKDVTDFLACLNSINAHIKFTMEMVKDGHLFLDTITEWKHITGPSYSNYNLE